MSLSSRAKIAQLVSRSCWSTQALLKPAAEPVSAKVLDQILDLSGLSRDIPQQRRAELQRGLSQQLALLQSLHDAPSVVDTGLLTRLVDDKSDKFLTYEDILSQIESLQPAKDKGELENSWEVTKQAKEVEDGYVVVNEGLVKPGSN